MATRRKPREKRPNFTAEFQTALLGAILKDEELLARYRKFLDASYWADEKEAEIVEAILGHFDDEGKPPPTGLLSQTLVDNYYWGAEAVEDKLAQLADSTNKGAGEHLLAFVLRQKTKDRLIEALDFAEQGKLPQVQEAINGLLDIAKHDEVGRASYIEEALTRFQKYEKAEKEERITTGVKSVDDMLNGGIARGELGTIIGQTKIGKSIVLVNFGKGAMLAGYKVLHVTLELSLLKTAQRYDTSITQIGKGGLYENTEDVREIYKEKIGDVDVDALTILEYPEDSLGVAVLEREAARVVPDLLILDYGDLMGMPQKYREIRHELAKTWRGLRAIAKKLNCGVWTATQLNRAGADKRTVTGKDVAECWEKIAISDMVLTLNQTPEEEEKNKMRIFLSEGRDVEDHKTAVVYIDRARALIKDFRR